MWIIETPNLGTCHFIRTKTSPPCATRKDGTQIDSFWDIFGTKVFRNVLSHRDGNRPFHFRSLLYSIGRQSHLTYELRCRCSCCDVYSFRTWSSAAPSFLQDIRTGSTTLAPGPSATPWVRAEAPGGAAGAAAAARPPPARFAPGGGAVEPLGSAGAEHGARRAHNARRGGRVRGFWVGGGIWDVWVWGNRG